MTKIRQGFDKNAQPRENMEEVVFSMESTYDGDGNLIKERFLGREVIRESCQRSGPSLARLFVEE